MKMNVRHRLPASPDVAWREIFSDAYSQAVAAQTGANSERISEEVKDGKRLIRSRVTLARELPSAAAKVMGGKHLTYVLEERIDDANHILQWRVLVDKVSDKVKAEGVFRLLPAAEGCERVIQGEVTVGVPLIGRKIEASIAAELEKSYEATAKFAHQWLIERA
ncbi:MAG: hypothetical protein ACI8RZ_005031 [Myxococcota bacterium]|jgi:hypothetical protein